jgi:uracil-DNA glycosylase
VQPQWNPHFRTETQQSEDRRGRNPPVEGFRPAANGHTDLMARTKATGSAADYFPETVSLPALREAAAGCKGCHLWESATQTVFGEGPAGAKIMFVGEQPGDHEDRVGRPFVGPAGRLFDQALEAAGIDRSETYMTNAVKHFKWKASGKRRIHQKPNWAEMTACRPWLEAELTVVGPRVLVLLGATAAQSLLGREFRVTQNRRKLLDSDLAESVTATIHPSAILRGEPEQRDSELAAFVDDLRFVKSLV